MWLMSLEKKFGLIYHKISEILCFSLLYVLLCGCSTIKEVPIQQIDRIEYRDSVVFVHDTISVPVPYEVIREVIPDIDTSYLETSVARSVAYLDKEKKQLSHSLEQKGEVKTKYDTVIVVEYVDKYIEREIPVTVEVEKPYIPKFFWIITIYAAIISTWWLIKLWMKLRR